MSLVSRYHIIQASTKTGKTVSCIVWLIERALEWGTGNYWWIAPIREQAYIAFERTRGYIQPRQFIQKTNETKLKIHLRNGAVLHFRHGQNPDTLFGSEVKALVIDEATRCVAKVWEAARSTLSTTKGPARIIGNVKGRHNWVYELHEKGERMKRLIASGTPSEIAHNSDEILLQWKRGEIATEKIAVEAPYKQLYDTSIITAWDAVNFEHITKLSYAEVMQAKADLPEHVFKELYLAEPSEDGSNPIGFTYLDKAKMDELSPEEPVFFGIDFGRHVDPTAVVGLDRKGNVAYHDTFKHASLAWRDILTRAGEALARYSFSVLDITGVGDALIEQFQEIYPSVSVYGFHFNSLSKKELFDSLFIAIQNGETRFPAYVEGYDEQLSEQLYKLEVSYSGRNNVRYEAPPGKHDDLVDAYAMAWRAYLMRGGQTINAPTSGTPGLIGIYS